MPPKTAASANSKRAEIERRLAELQMQKAQEEALLEKMGSADAPVVAPDEAGDPSAIRALVAAAEADVSAVEVYGATVSVGDTVPVVDDLFAFRQADAALPATAKNSLKNVYLGEPGVVRRILGNAVELEFVDGAVFFFATSCLAVGDKAERMASTKAARQHQTAAKKPAASTPTPTTTSVASARRPPPTAAAAVDNDESAADDRALRLPASLPKRGQPVVLTSGKHALQGVLAKDVAGSGASTTDDAIPLAPTPAAATKRPTTAKARPVTTGPTVGSKPVATSRHADPAAGVVAGPAKTASSTVAPKSCVPARAAPAAKPATKVPSSATGARTVVPPTTSVSSHKPLCVRVYDNGSYGDSVNDRVPYRTVTIRPTYKSLASAMTLMSDAAGRDMGRKVVTVYDASTGREIQELGEVKDGMCIVASSGEAFVPPRPNSQLFSVLPAESQQHYKAPTTSGAARRPGGAVKR